MSKSRSHLPRVDQNIIEVKSKVSLLCNLSYKICFRGEILSIKKSEDCLMNGVRQTEIIYFI